jgi:hypothetical protein
VVEALEVRVGDELEEVPVAGLVAHEDREVAVLLLVLPGRAVEPAGRGDVGLDAHDRLHAGLLPGRVEVERPEHHAVVGHGERRHPELGGPVEHVADAGRPVEERILRMRVQVDEALAGHGPHESPGKVAVRTSCGKPVGALWRITSL